MRRDERNVMVVNVSICVGWSGGIALLTCFGVRGFDLFGFFESGGARGWGERGYGGEEG